MVFIKGKHITPLGIQAVRESEMDGRTAAADERHGEGGFLWQSSVIADKDYGA